MAAIVKQNKFKQMRCKASRDQHWGLTAQPGFIYDVYFSSYINTKGLQHKYKVVVVVKSWGKQSSCQLTSPDRSWARFKEESCMLEFIRFRQVLGSSERLSSSTNYRDHSVKPPLRAIFSLIPVCHCPGSRERYEERFRQSLIKRLKVSHLTASLAEINLCF